MRTELRTTLTTKPTLASTAVAAAVLLQSLSSNAQQVCADGCADPVTSSVACDDSCTVLLSGSAPVNVGPGQIACVEPETEFLGGINLNGGEVRICGSARPSHFNFGSGSTVVLGELVLNSLNLNAASATLSNFGTLQLSNASLQGALFNHGQAAVDDHVNLNAGGEIYNTGSLSIGQSLNNTGTVTNSGTLDVGDGVQQNGGSFDNACVATTGGNVNLSGGNASNSGLLEVGATLTVSLPLELAAGSQLAAEDLLVNAAISGPTTSCASLLINDTTHVNGSASVSGSVDLCDATGIEASHGALGPSVTTDCSCSPDFSCEASPRLFWIDISQGALEAIDLDGTNRERLVEREFGAVRSRLVVDPVEEHLYWLNSGVGEGALLRSNLDGSEVTEILSIDPDSDDIEIDVANRRLYWADDGARTLYSANLDGTDLQTYEDLSLREIALDPESGVVYGLETSQNWDLVQIDLATGEVTQLRNLAGLGFHIGLEFDTVNDKLYLATFGEPYRRMDSDGSNLEALAVTGTVPGDLVVSGEQGLVCWTDAIEDIIACGDLDMQNASLVTDSGLDVVSSLAVLFPADEP